jgi:hypothetical protein
MRPVTPITVDPPDPPRRVTGHPTNPGAGCPQQRCVPARRAAASLPPEGAKPPPAPGQHSQRSLTPASPGHPPPPHQRVRINAPPSPLLRHTHSPSHDSPFPGHRTPRTHRKHLARFSHGQSTVRTPTLRVWPRPALATCAAFSAPDAISDLRAGVKVMPVAG